MHWIHSCFFFFTGWWSTDSRCATSRRGIDFPAARDGAPLSEVRGNSTHDKAHFCHWTWFHSDTVFIVRTCCGDDIAGEDWSCGLVYSTAIFMIYHFMCIYKYLLHYIWWNLNVSLYRKVCQVVWLFTDFSQAKNNIYYDIILGNRKWCVRDPVEIAS